MAGGTSWSCGRGRGALVLVVKRYIATQSISHWTTHVDQPQLHATQAGSIEILWQPQQHVHSRVVYMAHHAHVHDHMPPTSSV